MHVHHCMECQHKGWLYLNCKQICKRRHCHGMSSFSFFVFLCCCCCSVLAFAALDAATTVRVSCRQMVAGMFSHSSCSAGSAPGATRRCLGAGRGSVRVAVTDLPNGHHVQWQECRERLYTRPQSQCSCRATFFLLHLDMWILDFLDIAIYIHTLCLHIDIC